MHTDEIKVRLGNLKAVLDSTNFKDHRDPTQAEYAEMKRNALQKAKVFHNVVHVYNNDSHRHHCVPDFELESCVSYNTTMRFGRAIFVDGKCVHKGYLDAERIAAWEEKIKDWPMPKLSYPRS